MSRFFCKCLWLAGVVLIVSCNHKNDTFDSEDGLAAFSKDSLTQHIIALASDEFQGRRPFTAGETRTVDYLSKSFANLGLEPGNGNSYFQDVPMVEITPPMTRR